MTYFFFYLLCFSLGGIFIFFGIKRRPTRQFRYKITELQNVNINLQNKNNDLVEIIHQNQQDIKFNQQEIKELKEVVAILSGQVVLNLEIMSSVTKIREQVDNIDAEIVITKRFKQKYSQYLSD